MCVCSGDSSCVQYIWLWVHVCENVCLCALTDREEVTRLTIWLTRTTPRCTPGFLVVEGGDGKHLPPWMSQCLGTAKCRATNQSHTVRVAETDTWDYWHTTPHHTIHKSQHSIILLYQLHTTPQHTRRHHTTPHTINANIQAWLTTAAVLDVRSTKQRSRGTDLTWTPLPEQFPVSSFYPVSQSG